MFFQIISILYIGFITYSASPASHEFGADDAKRYLSQFGYMQESIHGLNSLSLGTYSYSSGNGISPDDHYSEALAKFQEYFSLTVTGKLNNETVSKMKAPRCGFKDIENPESARNNSMFQKFVHIGQKFEKRHVTYAISKYTKKLPKSVIDDTIRQAFGVWSEVVPLTFTQKKSAPVDIHVGFFRQRHRLPSGHSCNRFDGSSGVLAHAVPPSHNMFLHFDEDERWSVGSNTRSGIDLFLVAVHEIGHNIGLDHTNVRGAIMYPTYSFMPNFKLHNDDIRGAQAMYGSKEGRSGSRRPSGSWRPDGSRRPNHIPKNRG